MYSKRILLIYIGISSDKQNVQSFGIILQIINVKQQLFVEKKLKKKGKKTSLNACENRVAAM